MNTEEENEKVAEVVEAVEVAEVEEAVEVEGSEEVAPDITEEEKHFIEGDVPEQQGNAFTDLYPEMLWTYFETLKYSRLKIEDTILKMAEERKDVDPVTTLMCFLPVEQKKIGLGLVKTKISHRKNITFYNFRDVLKAFRFRKDQIEKTDERLYIQSEDLEGLKRASFRGFKKRGVINTVEKIPQPIVEENKEEMQNANE